MQKNSKKNIFFLFFTFFTLLFAYSQESNFQSIKLNTKNLPTLNKLSSKNDLFKEYSAIVESNYKRISSGKKPEIIFFLYKNSENFSLHQLASRCNIPYETIATLNCISTSNEDISNKTLILPTVSGLFVCLSKTTSPLEVLLQENHSFDKLDDTCVKYTIGNREYILLLNNRLTPTERAFFLDSGLRLPLDRNSFWISSEFGKRKNPFSGQIKNHNGIDMAAPEGTPVYAIKDANVSNIVLNDPVFGNYIILSHDNGKMMSIYAHLSKVCAEEFDSIKKGDIIGYVGQTGMATGPHLHFEIKQGGRAQDPRQKLNLN